MPVKGNHEGDMPKSRRFGALSFNSR